MTKYIVDIDNKKAQIDKNIYGHFSEHLGRCIYEGIYVGEDSDIPNVNGIRCDVVEALKKIKVPVLRWPGGCFADEYHWKDGIGPKETRKRMINTHWGGAVEDNSFGTHEFMELCDQVGCEPYINGNVGSGSPQEMSEWVEYLTFNGTSPMAELREKNGRKEAWSVKYFGVGNENWGCGGSMRPEYYADEYRKFQTYVRNYDGNKIYKIACGASSADYNWTKVLMEVAGNHMDALTVHYYTVTGDTWDAKGAATGFDAATYYKTLHKTAFMDELLDRHEHIMDQFDPKKRVALIVDEWGSWFDVEPGTNPGFLYQQNTMRDAMITGINLNIFNKHAERVRMANIAQTINVLQAVILTDREKMIKTPTFHVFDLFSVHHDATLLDSYVTTNLIGNDDMKVADVFESASIDAEGNVNITICNIDIESSKTVDGIVKGLNASAVTGQILTGKMDALNTFEAPEAVQVEDFTDITWEVASEGTAETNFKMVLPTCSVVRLTFKK